MTRFRKRFDSFTVEDLAKLMQDGVEHLRNSPQWAGLTMTQQAALLVKYGYFRGYADGLKDTPNQGD